MKTKRFLTSVAVCILAVMMIVLAACTGSGDDGAGPGMPDNGGSDYAELEEQGNAYTEIVENPFIEVTETNNKSVIALSVNTAAYSDIRRQILAGEKVNKNAVKIEEMVNYFKYDYTLPEAGKPLSMNSVIMDAPWNNETKLLLVGMRADDVSIADTKNNIVLLVDVSGSMYGADRLGLVVDGFGMLVDQLDENDTVSIVTYASGVQVVLDGADGSEKARIKDVLAGLKASGSTAGGAAITTAYSVAEKYKGEDIKSSIIIATDGDFNVGISDPEALKALLSEKRGQGISLSAVGVGFGNMKNNMLETIAYSGGGRHIYMNSSLEARRFFVEELDGILNIVARDAKAQIEFNPAKIASYRLLGYENRQLSLEDWLDDEALAGTVGSGTVVTAMYEVKLKDALPGAEGKGEDALPGAEGEAGDTLFEGSFAKVSVRYKQGESEEVFEDTLEIDESFLAENSEGNPLVIKKDDRIFISAVIEFSLILRDSQYKGTANTDSIFERLDTVSNIETDPYRSDFSSLLATYVTGR